MGLSNYTRIAFHDVVLPQAIRTTLHFAFAAVVLEVLGGLAFALLFWRYLSRRRAIASLFLVPSALSPVVVGLLWKLILQSEFGVGTYLFRRLGLLGEASLLGGDGALAVVILVDFWQWTPFVAAVLAMALVTQPQRFLEMAQIDGARSWQVLRDITLPFLAPLLGAVTLLRLVDALREFEKISILTGGGPGIETEVLNLYVWRITFREWDLGYGSALAVTGYLFSFLVTTFLFRLFIFWRSSLRAYT